MMPHMFMEQRAAVRGAGNPQRMHVPLWEELIRSGETAYDAACRYGFAEANFDDAGWCFDRFGMTRTRLPDGRIVCIGGEHEDYYDPDFFIYNDVILIAPGGEIEIYGYDPAVFPPTDNHTATLCGDAIYIIGGLGYPSQRKRASTPVYRLDVRSMRIREVIAGGDSPGCIYGHEAQRDGADPRSVRVSGGKQITFDDAGKERHGPCDAVFNLHWDEERWSAGDGDELAPLAAGDPLALPGWRGPRDQEKAQHLRNSIVRAVPPDHPLFCGDFHAIAVNEQVGRVALQMLDDSGRWAICDEPDYTGRQDPPPLAVKFYATRDQLRADARSASEAP